MEYNKLFIGGDLSGIQKFLYNIVSRKAAVTLKGRSDYLREYMLTICDKLEKVANEAGAKSTKVIYKSGGKFYLITDHTLAITQAIDARVRAIKRELWEQQHGELSINISYVAFSENADQTVNVAETDLMPAMSQAPIGQLWKVVNAAFARQKHQKFKEVLCDQYESLFTPLPVGGQPKICDITGIESDKCVRLEDEDMCVLPSVKAQIELGKRLRKEQGFKEFNDYADLGGGASTYLGILRMDVDGLGKRFITGFRSFDDYQRFSNRLVQFFEKEIVNIQHESVFRDYLNVIYSGGDDLFVVGRWDKTIDFAERVHQEVSTHFRADGISISGGVAIVSPKFPIAKSAEMAGEAEDLAKQYCNGEKNAFHMLGKTISWKGEFDEVKKLKNRFNDLLHDTSLSKGILHRIMLYDSIARHNKELRQQGKPEDFSYIWHLTYYLARYAKRYSDDKAVVNLCSDLKNISTDADRLQRAALSARWAELLLRIENPNNN